MLFKADQVIIPLTPSQADVWATQRFLRFTKNLRAEDMPTLYALINRGDPGHSNPDTMDTHEILGTIKELTVIDCVIYDNEDFRASLYEGQACFEFNPDGQAAKEFNRVAEFLFKKTIC